MPITPTRLFKPYFPCSRSHLRLRGRALSMLETFAVERGLAPEAVLDELLTTALNRARARLAPLPSWRSLTHREREIVLLILQGYPYSHIARVLRINPQTVRCHVRSIFRKYGVHSRADLHRRIEAEGGPMR